MRVPRLGRRAELTLSCREVLLAIDGRWITLRGRHTLRLPMSWYVQAHSLRCPDAFQLTLRFAQPGPGTAVLLVLRLFVEPRDADRLRDLLRRLPGLSHGPETVMHAPADRDWATFTPGPETCEIRDLLIARIANHPAEDGP